MYRPDIDYTDSQLQDYELAKLLEQQNSYKVFEQYERDQLRAYIYGGGGFQGGMSFSSNPKRWEQHRVEIKVAYATVCPVNSWILRL